MQRSGGGPPKVIIVGPWLGAAGWSVSYPWPQVGARWPGEALAAAPGSGFTWIVRCWCFNANSGTSF